MHGGMRETLGLVAVGIVLTQTFTSLSTARQIAIWTPLTGIGPFVFYRASKGLWTRQSPTPRGSGRYGSRGQGSRSSMAMAASGCARGATVSPGRWIETDR